ncbi:MAG: hypothetical protein KC503_28285, partial [Myxococcales bacterium]|nr:hypothetical protein [Myxococcales bacterium]
MRPTLATVDWAVIGAYVLFAFVIGSLFVKKASQGVESFFVGDRKLPWWLAGTSIVATTFAADTPLAVTGIVAGAGVSGNWLWWGSAIAQVISTFFFARLWRRAGVITDAEVTELRYGGRAAAALRGFKALYFGLFVNTLTMGWVISAMVKISRAFFDVSPAVVIAVCIVTSVCYTTLGGFRSVVITDFVQFLLSVVGAVALAAMVSSRYGGLGAQGDGAPSLLTSLGEVAARGGSSLAELVSFIPSGHSAQMSIPLFIVLLSAGWWSQCEGNGYVVQRLAACRDEAQAEGAALWFAVAHHALRPWPWIIVGLAALVVFPPQGRGAAPARLAAREAAT